MVIMFPHMTELGIIGCKVCLSKKSNAEFSKTGGFLLIVEYKYKLI